MGKFTDFLEEKKKLEMIMLSEHKIYRDISGTRQSYREDPSNLNTHTVTHSHVYAKPNGKGKELYSVNFDGTGHDGFSGYQMSKKHADFFRNKEYDIPVDNVLENIIIDSSNSKDYEFLLLED